MEELFDWHSVLLHPFRLYCHIPQNIRWWNINKYTFLALISKMLYHVQLVSHYTGPLVTEKMNVLIVILGLPLFHWNVLANMMFCVTIYMQMLLWTEHYLNIGKDFIIIVLQGCNS